MMMPRIAMRRRLLAAGFLVSLVCLGILFADALRAAKGAEDPMGLAGTTAVGPAGQAVTAVFFVLNIPPALLLLALQSMSAMKPLAREIVAYSVTTAAVIGWWWGLAALARRRGKRT